ncbi:MAG: hypothetical protein JWN46_3822 [Acidimicrobiales bacterium]|nr:hypothetical protein [Acidimicrobiales bacterium]
MTASFTLDPVELAAVVASLDDATAPVTAAWSLPPACYTSESFYAFEREAVFGRSWLGLGRLEQIPAPGDWFSIEVAGEPLLVVRGAGQEVHVLSNVCTHRQHLIAEGTGHVDRYFRCPLHSWAFERDGTLAHPAGMQDTEGFDRADWCLPRLRAEVWHGFIFANHDPEAAPLAPSLAKLEPEAEAYGLADLVTTEPWDTDVLPWNWKTMHEGGIEPFHSHFLHKGLHEFAPWADFHEFEPGDGAVTHYTRFREPDQSFNPIYRTLLPVFPGLDEERRQRVMFVAMLPTLYFGFMPDHVFWLLVLPESAGSIRLRQGYLVHPDARDVPNFDHRIEWIADGLSAYFRDDATANASTQRGRASRYARRGRYASEEQPLPMVNRWLAERYRAGYRKLVPEQAATFRPRLVAP